MHGVFVESGPLWPALRMGSSAREVGEAGGRLGGLRDVDSENPKDVEGIWGFLCAKWAENILLYLLCCDEVQFLHACVAAPVIVACSKTTRKCGCKK